MMPNLLLILFLLPGPTFAAAAAAMTTTLPSAQAKTSASDKVNTKVGNTTSLSKDDKTIILLKDNGNSMPWWGRTHWSPSREVKKCLAAWERDFKQKSR
jgi:hypothetical protein